MASAAALLCLAGSPTASPGGSVSTELPAGLAVAALGPCPDGGAVADTGMCTHGSDPMPDEIRVRGVPRPISDQVALDASSVGCDGDGVSGKRVQAIYAYVAGRLNRKSTYLPSFRSWAANVDAMFDASAHETGGSRRLRWVTNARCLLNVPAVALSADAELSFGTMVSELAAKGYARDDRKYLVWFDTDQARSQICGVAGVWLDDQPSAANANDHLRGYARIDAACWNFAEQHEVMHTLGAVQGSAPNHSAALHCVDEYDQMCYADGPNVVLRYVCPARFERLFDCNHDDYFSTDPTSGSYLASHWNTANSGWLVGAPAPPPANDDFAEAVPLNGSSGSIAGSTESATSQIGEPANGASSPPINSVWYAWQPESDGIAAVDTCGSGFDTTLGVYAGDSLTALSEVATNDDDPWGACGRQSRVTFNATGGTTYWLSVDGVADATGAFSLGYELNAGADLDPPSASTPQIEIVGGQRMGRKVVLHLSWPASSDTSGIARYELQLRKGTGAWVESPLEEPSATSADVALKPGADYDFRLRAIDGVGNTGQWAGPIGSRLSRFQEDSSAITYSARFKRAYLSGSSGGHVRKTGVAGRTATLAFEGSSVAFVTTLGPTRGILEVRVDEGAWQEIDSFAGSLSTRQLVWSATVVPGAHRVDVRVTGDANPGAAGARIDVDAFVVW